MADEIEIQIGNETFRVPRWATEETAREMSKYNAASAKALTELLRLSSRNNKVANENQKIFRDLKDATKRDQKENLKADKKLKEAQSKYGKALTDTSKSLVNASKNITESFSKNSLAGIAAAIGSVVGLGAAAGFTVGVLEKFAQNISNLTNVGIGFGLSITELRQQAAQTGLDLEAYGNLVMSNGDALRAIGENAQDGARRFSMVSEQARILARDFNNYGMTNQEFNEVLLQEIELRRRAGASQQELTQGLSSAMQRLMVETTAMATLTGQDRREMLRRRQEAMADPSIEAARMAAMRRGGDIADNITAMSDVFGAGGDVGSQIGQAIMTAIFQDRDFRAVRGGAMARMATLDQDVAAQLTEMQEFARVNRETMDPREFRARLLSMAAQIPEMVDSNDLDRLGLLADTGDEAAAQLISFVAELEGLGTSVEENLRGMVMAEQQMAKTALIGLASSVEEATNRIKASALTSVIEGLGVEVNSAGQELVDAIRGISDNFGTDVILWDGLKETYTDLTDTMDRLTHAAGVAAAALVGLSMFSGGRKLLGWIGKGIGKVAGGAAGALGLGRGASWLKNLISGGAKATGRAAATGAATAGVAGKSLLSRALAGLLRFGAKGGPIGLGIGLGLAPTGTGLNRDEQWQQENPFPEQGTREEQEDWQRRREEFNNSVPIWTQEEINAEQERIRRSRIPMFDDLDPFEQTNMRLNTPGTRGYLDNMREGGFIDPETHAVLTGRPIPGRPDPMSRPQPIERMDELIESNRVIADKMQRMLSWLEQNS